MYHEGQKSGFGMPCCGPAMRHTPRGCRIGFGIMLILIGVFLLGSRMGWFDQELFWPVAILAAGIAVLVRSQTHGERMQRGDMDKGGTR